MFYQGQKLKRAPYLRAPYPLGFFEGFSKEGNYGQKGINFLLFIVF